MTPLAAAAGIAYLALDVGTHADGNGLALCLSSLTFLLLVAEMSTFVGLVLPLPFTVRKKMFAFLNENPMVAKVCPLHELLPTHRPTEVLIWF